jgi:hypothetical protein
MMLLIITSVAFLQSTAASEHVILNKYENNAAPITFARVGSMFAVKRTVTLDLEINLLQLTQLSLNILKSRKSLEEQLECAKKDAFPGCTNLLKQLDTIIERNIENLHALTSHESKRRKRAIDMLGNIIRAISGNLDQTDLNSLSSRLGKLQEKQNEIIESENKGKEIVVELFETIKATSNNLTTMFNNVANKVEDLRTHEKLAAEIEIVSEFHVQVEEFNHQIEATLELISSKRISGKVLKAKTLNDAAATVRKALHENEQFPFNSILREALQSKVSIKIEDLKITASLTLPITEKAPWTLYKVQRTPITTGETITVIEAPAEIARSPDGRVSLIHNRDNCWSNLKQETICILTEGVSSSEESCFAQALVAKEITSKLCAPLLHTAKFTNNVMIRMSKDTILMLIKNKASIKIRCENGESIEERITSHTLIRATEACKLSIDEEKLDFYLIPDKRETYSVTIKTTSNINIITQELTPVLGSTREGELHNFDHLEDKIKSFSIKKLIPAHIDNVEFTSALTLSTSIGIGVISLMVCALCVITCCCIKK